MTRFFRLLTLVSLSFVACGTPPAERQYFTPTAYLDEPARDGEKAWPSVNTSHFSKISRSEVLQRAQAYLNHEWYATPQNVFHGTDARGIRVDTPDVEFRPAGDTPPGYWVPGQVNRGIPYQWGGFSTPPEFDAGLRQGKYAGDVSNSYKRNLLDDAVSSQCVGVDCSGFISRCWNLPRSYSTRELPGLCDPVMNWDELRAGDILNTRNEHVMLFEGWANAGRTGLIVYETGSPPDWKVVRHGLKRLPLLRYGYRAFRYRNIRD
jgi:hypothetical protein